MGPGEQSELSGSPGPESSPGASPGVTLLFSSPGDPLRGLLPETSPSWPQACSRPGLALCYKKVIFGWMGSWLQQAGVLALWRAGAALQPWSTGSVASLAEHGPPGTRGVFPMQGLNPGLPHCGQVLFHLSHQGNPARLW